MLLERAASTSEVNTRFALAWIDDGCPRRPNSCGCPGKGLASPSMPAESSMVPGGRTKGVLTNLHPWIFPIALTCFARSLRIGPKHDFWPLPRWLNRAFGSIYRMEALWLRHAALPFGVSVACVARRGP